MLSNTYFVHQEGDHDVIVHRASGIRVNVYGLK